jgi:tetratricopeptide (TPR) repeat protein
MLMPGMAVAGRWLGHLKQALSDCNESLRLRSSFAPALDSRGFTYLKLGELDAAISDYDQALRLNPKRAISLYGRGLARQKKGDSVGGNADIEAAKEISPNLDEEFARYGVR